MDLSAFDRTAIEQITDYWRKRPIAKTYASRKSPKPISLATVEHQLKTFRRFLRWVDDSDRFDWQIPRRGLDATRAKLRTLRTPEETSRLARGPDTFSVDHLTLIWKHATDSERVIVLLGLNAAMTAAEMAGLRHREIHETMESWTIKRVRHKSGVYGEFHLWPETVQALRWWRSIRGGEGELVLQTAEGQPFQRQRLANQWAALRDRLARETSGVPTWWLPLKYLRKTAAHLVREAADGEIAGVFLSHGQPVATDGLSDLYTRRPFDKVAKALAVVRVKLEPMFAAVPDAFTSTRTGGRGPAKGSRLGKRAGEPAGKRA